MKLLHYIAFLVLSSFNLNAQGDRGIAEPVRIESNGIKVYEALGNEPLTGVHQAQKTSSHKSIEEFTIEECTNSLYYIDLKIDKEQLENGDTEQLRLYQAQRARIIARKNILTSKTK